MSDRKVVMITGGSGFIGANLAHRLVEQGHYVHLLLHKNTGRFPWRIADINEHVKLDFYSFEEQDSIQIALHNVQPDWVFHLAAHGAYSWQKDTRQILAANYLFTAELLDAAVSVECQSFVNTGTSAEYGNKDHAPKEDEPLEPQSYYAATKAGATALSKFMAQYHSMNIPTLRLYSVFGPFEQPDRLMTNLIAEGLEGKWPTLAHQSFAHDFVYVDDVIDAYLLAANRTADGGDFGAVYNIGTGTQTNLQQVTEVAKKLLPIKTEPNFGSMENREWDAEVWVCDNSKAKNELGWQPQFTFEQGLQKMITWFENSPHLQPMYREHLRDFL